MACALTVYCGEYWRIKEGPIMSGTQARNACFYSPNCKWSLRFLEAVRQTEYKGMFRYFNVNDPTVRQKYRWLKKVPTLIIDGEQEARTDEAVMNWLFEQKLKTGQKNPPPAYNQPAPRYPGGQMPLATQQPDVAGNSEPEAWVANEMSGNARLQYTGMNDENMYTKSGNYEIFNPNAPNNMPSGGVGTRSGSMMTSTVGEVNSRSRNEQLFDKQMESYLKSRDTGVPRPPPRQ